MRYTVQMSGHQWAKGPIHSTNTLKDARAIAEEFGSTADLAVVEIAHGRNKGKIVAVFKRSPDGDGMTWYRSVPPWLT